MTSSYIEISHSSGQSKLFVDHISVLGNIQSVCSVLQENCTVKKGKTNRKILVEGLKRQYQEAGIIPEGAVKSNIDLLTSENTFTVTTGHQLCIFSGPLYVIQKIVTAVYVAQRFNALKNGNTLVPVYWMATEDHDVDEISSVQVFREKITALFGVTGPTGNLPAAAVAALLPKLKELAGNLSFAKEINNLIEECYKPEFTLRHAHRKFIHALTAHLGVIIVDGDEAEWKKEFSPVVQKELTSQIVYSQVEKQNEKLKKQGYHAQVNPRDLNLFMLGEHSRERIDKTGAGFTLVDSGKDMTNEDVIALLKSKPQSFSPNVLLRPLYQCSVLPDVAMVGGPAELAYWKQLELLFAHEQVPMPLLLPRMFCFYVNEKQQSLWDELKNEGADFFASEETWVGQRAKKSMGNLSLSEEETQLNNWFEAIKTKASEVDKTLPGFIDAEKARSKKFIDSLNEKMVRAVKKNEETQLQSVRQLHAKLFPEGKWQERHESALPYLWRYGKEFVDILLKNHPEELNRAVIITT